MTERRRARLKDGTVVTVIDGRQKLTGQVEIRNGSGFREKVSHKELTLIPDDESGAKLKFG